MKASFFFLFRIALAWLLALLAASIVFQNTIGRIIQFPSWPFVLLGFFFVGYGIASALSHIRRIRLIAGHVDSLTLANRQRRKIELPLDTNDSFDMIDAAVRELPRTQNVESVRDSLQVRAKVERLNPYGEASLEHQLRRRRHGTRSNLITATISPGDGASSVTLICEPESGAWLDFWFVDDGTNLENAEAITRAVTRRLAERRRNESELAKQTSTEKELAVAKLSLLHAQVEPHFLYNTLASAQYLTRTDPARADEMLGNLITYLRRSLPRTEDSPSTLGEELERARAYLDIQKIRMGARLNLHIDVPDTLKTTPFPTMMLQTLVENAIKHGLEPKPGGGTIWIICRETDSQIAVTVADDGRGFNAESSGTGIGLKNIRERLRLAYGAAATFIVAGNFPNGVAATITIPSTPVTAPQHA